MGNFINIFILTWKNFKLQIRHPRITLLELLLPAFLMFLLIIFRFISPVIVRKIETVFDSYDINYFPEEVFSTSGNLTLYYSPKSEFLDKIMQDVSTELNTSVTGFATEEELLTSYRTARNVVIGVIFNGNLRNGVKYFGPIEFTIRPEHIPGLSWNLSHAMPHLPFVGIRDNSVYGTHYMTQGFIPVQHTISKALLNSISSRQKNFDDMFLIRMCRQPYPPHSSDSFYSITVHYFIIAIGAGFFVPSAMIAKNIVHEKQTKLGTYLKMIGVSGLANWIAWFIKDFIFFCVYSLIMTILLSTRFGGRAVFNQSDASIIFLMLILYASALMTFIFFITCFFKKANSAVAAICIFFILTFLPFTHYRGLFFEVPLTFKLILCILPNTLFASSLQIVYLSEIFGKGVQWKTLHQSDAVGVYFSMYTALLLYFLDIFIYLILTWYFEVIFSDPHHKYPWYFPLTSQLFNTLGLASLAHVQRNTVCAISAFIIFITSHTVRKLFFYLSGNMLTSCCIMNAAYWTDIKYIPPTSSGYRLLKPQFEVDPPKVKPMIDIRNLTKKFGKYSKPSVNDVSLKAYKGQITALLGYHCSGKSTCTSMIYGSMTPTSGTITLKGHDMHKSGALAEIIPLLGICPEYDVSVDELNVGENLYFFGRIKGFDMIGMHAEISHILGILDLENEKNMLASTLAVSSKRKLSVGISLIGESEIVILDEPTLEMDSEDERIVWDALKSEKKRRAIFLSTSHIKEAYAVADKIAVIDNGELKCCGSPDFLKKIYAAGYLLKMSKEPDCNSIVVQNLISSYIPGALFINETETELSVMLPHDSKHLYHILFKELEEKDLKIKDYIVTESTLDDLFMRILQENFDPSLNSKAAHTKKTLKKISSFHHLTRKRNDGFTLFLQHAIALLKKRYFFSLRNSFLAASQLLIFPLIIIFSNLMAENIFIDIKGSISSINFDMNLFGKTYVPYGIDPNSNITIDLGDTYAAMLSDSESLYLVDLDEENYLTYLIKQGMMNYKIYKTKYVIGAVFAKDFNRTLITAFYDAEAFHSAPISLLYVHNTILSYYTKTNAYYFSVKNEPLPFKDTYHKFLSANIDMNLPFFWAEDLMIGMAILMSSFVILVVIEKSSKFKKLQMISGLNSFVYWLSNLIYDYCIYLISCLFVILILSVFETQCLNNDAELGALVILLGLHGLSALLFIYCWTFCFKSAPACYIGIYLYYYFAQLLLYCVDTFEEDNNHYVSEPLDIIFSLFFSSYCIARGVYNIFRNCIGKLVCHNHLSETMCFYKNATFYIATACCPDTCGDTCIPWTPSYFSLLTPGIGRQLIALVVQLFFLIIILILLEMESFHYLKSCIPKRHHYFYSTFQSDNSVQEEAEHILTSSIPKLLYDNYVLVLKNASKVFSRYLIQKVSLGVQKGECFGLIGIDRAGKSTILKMISGCIELSDGNIYIDGIDVSEYPDKLLDKVGFSFGHFPFLNHLTVEDTLTLFARIRGIPENKIELFLEALVDILALNYHVLIKNCNDTDKRKLNVAIAVIGNPPLILLDEPTHQMDPVACMRIHEVIRQALSVGCTVFFTTRRIEECKALCKRVAILVKGKLTFIGQIKDLKEQYEEGYTLILRIPKVKKRGHTRVAVFLTGSLDEIKGIIDDAVPQAMLKIEYASYLNYYVPNRTVKFSELFNLLEKMIIQENIYDYSVCETTLGHIFSYHGCYAENLKHKRIADYLKERQHAILT